MYGSQVKQMFGDRSVVMTLFALWYTHTAEGRRLLEGRKLRLLLVAVGVVAAYALLWTHPRFSHQ